MRDSCLCSKRSPFIKYPIYVHSAQKNGIAKEVWFFSRDTKQSQLIVNQQSHICFILYNLQVVASNRTWRLYSTTYSFTTATQTTTESPNFRGILTFPVRLCSSLHPFSGCVKSSSKLQQKLPYPADQKKAR